jgi:hypothetical protein
MTTSTSKPLTNKNGGFIARIIEFPGAPSAATGAALITIYLALIHFYTMEVDFKGQLQVRPYGMLPFVTVSVAMFALLFTFYGKVKQLL